MTPTMSNLLRKRCLTVNEVQTRQSSSKKQRLVDATKMLLDIAKELADACTPLKSCLGGICALIKHYEECKDVEEKIGGLIPWLTKPKGSLTTVLTDENPEDVERRAQFTRSLEDIEKRSLMLSKKSMEARFFDKRQDAGVVVKLVEELRQAILIYQLSQQRSIHHQVTQLASSFGAFLKLREEPRGLKGKIESIPGRLNRFDAEGSVVGDRNESKRRIILFEALEGIKDELLPISERFGAAGYKENDADTRIVCEFAENVRDAIMEYQCAQQKAIYEQNCKLIDLGEQTVLNCYRRARGAGYQHGDRNGCLKGTRESVLDEIECWIENSKSSPVFWLNGLAGTGKTTIAQTVAERVFAEGRLGASFFCSRDFEDRRGLRFIFPTLAFQLAYKYPDFRTRLVSLLRTDPDIVYESLYNQMQKLIAEPLQAAGISTVIVIDALDECKDDEPSSAILSVLGRFVGQISEVKFFITGRPEPRIRTGFRLPLLIDLTDVFVLHDVHPTLVNSDIRLFLKHELSELAERRQLGTWPTDENIDLLCLRAAGLFVYAVATVKFLSSSMHLPKHRLDVILEFPESTAPEGTTPFKSETTLDSLYTSILQAAFSSKDPYVYIKVRAIIGTIVMVVNPLPPQAIAELTYLEPEEVTLYLTLIQSLLALRDDSNQPVTPFHKSFPDFITDRSRCPDPRFFISPRHLHLGLAMNCLSLMNDRLKQDLLSLPEYTLNSEVGDLQTRIDGRISIVLQYACRSWHSHLTKSKGNITDVIPHLRTFLEEKFLAWLEVLSVLGEVGGAVVALEKLMPWLQKLVKGDKLLDTARDCFYFVTKFFEPISASATHIYHSALELCPTSSIVRQLYYHRFSRITGLPRVVVGTPYVWDPTTSISGKNDFKFCTWSPGGRFVAALTGNAVEIRNHLTFELLTTLQPTETTPLLTGPLAYSPDGRSLACPSDTAIVIWDIQTGGVAKEIVHRVKTVSLVWSSDKRTIGTLECLSSGTVHTGTNFYAYDIATGAPSFVETIRSSHKPYLWAYKTSFRAMKIERSLHGPAKVKFKVKIFEVQSPLTTISTFNVTIKARAEGTEYSFGSEVVSFSPTTSRVAVLAGDKLLIFWDRSPTRLLQEEGHFLSPCFSSDGSLFAASKENIVYIWKCTSDPSSFFRWREFRCQDMINSLQFPPSSGPSFLSHSGNILQMSRLDDLPTTPKFHHRQHAALSRSGSRIATTYGLDGTIMIINPHSQSPSQLIDTGAEIEGMLLTSNILLVVGSDKLFSWRLSEDGLVDGAIGSRMRDCGDCIWTRPLSLSGHKLEFKVEGQMGVIEYDGDAFLIYHTVTGELIQDIQTPPRLSGPGYDPRGGLCGRHYLQHHNLSTALEDHQYPSETALREGWVRDHEGRYRLWLCVEWRKSWDLADWCHNITTQFSIIEDQSIVIKF